VMGCGVMKGDLKALDTVEVVAWGEKNEPAGYIPVKVHVSGTCEAQNPRCGADNNQLCPPEDESFNTRKEGLSSDQERPIVFHLKKGDFDAWTAEPQRPVRRKGQLERLGPGSLKPRAPEEDQEAPSPTPLRLRLR
jgi:hypothetical protein